MTIEEAEAKIAELEEKNKDLTTNLTNQRKTFDTEKAELTEKLTTAEATIKETEEAKASELTNYQESRIEAMSKGNKEIAEKIRAEYGHLNMDETSREGIDARALKAFQLATAPSVDGLAQRADSVQTDVETKEDGSMTPAAKTVYERMFPAAPGTQVTKSGDDPNTQA